jgi:hypothetical protein
VSPDLVRVAAILPFWRYAVGPASSHSAAVPFYRLGSAEAFFEETRRSLPWAGCVLYRRRGWSGIETLREHEPAKAVDSQGNG